MASVARIIAYKALREWDKKNSDPHQIIADLTSGSLKPEDKAFARDLFFGAIKYQRKIDYFATLYYRSKTLSSRLRTIMRLAFYQLINNTNIPAYAVVSESVELANKFCSKTQAGFINAVLRNYLREPDKAKLPSRDDGPVQYLGISYSFPDWLVERYIKRFGFEHTERLLDRCNQPPDLCFFINRYIISEKDTEKKLADQGIGYRKAENFPGYYICETPQQLMQSDIFGSGLIIIGDPAQGLAPQALQVDGGGAVCDLFAAPGGKTAALASRAGADGAVFASDYSINRIKTMRANVHRWRLDNVFIFCSDLLKFASSRKFRYILADVQCSGTGTIRRNPDLRWNLNQEDIARHARKQKSLIQAAADLLEPGGRLVYSTCSLESEENDSIIVNFLKHNSDYRLIQIGELQRFEVRPGIYETRPDRDKSDGAFVAVLEKIG